MGALGIPAVVLKFLPWALLVAGGLFAAWWLYDAGGDAERGQQIERTVQTQQRINDADARGPRTPDDVDKRLRDGSF